MKKILMLLIILTNFPAALAQEEAVLEPPILPGEVDIFASQKEEKVPENVAPQNLKEPEKPGTTAGEKKALPVPPEVEQKPEIVVPAPLPQEEEIKKPIPLREEKKMPPREQCMSDEQKIHEELAAANYCASDGDCMILRYPCVIDDEPCGLNYLVNKNYRHLDYLKAIIEKFKECRSDVEVINYGYKQCIEQSQLRECEDKNKRPQKQPICSFKKCLLME